MYEKKCEFNRATFVQVDPTNTCVSVNAEEAPSGMMARGHYDAVSQFIDDDDHSHLKFEWSFDIAKGWEK